jgi:hypothetical protein
MMRLLFRTAPVATVVLVAALGCGRERGEPAGSVVDSVVPHDTALARFREGLPAPTGLSNGAASRDELIHRFVSALEHSDTAGLRAMVMTRAEFGWLYYPWVPESRPPYDLAPGLMWFMVEGASARGLSALLTERGGRPLGFVDYRCEGERRYGANTVWGPCTMRRVQAPGDTTMERLFGPLVERGGRVKFVSLANKL